MSCNNKEQMLEMLYEEALEMGMDDEQASNYAEMQFELRSA